MLKSTFVYQEKPDICTVYKTHQMIWKKTSKKKPSWYGHYILWIKNNINPVLENALKKYPL